MIRAFAAARGIKAFHQTFLDRASFQHWVDVYDKEPIAGPKLLYVASHGGNGQLAGLRDVINRTTVVQTIAQAENIRFVHFGSCFFGSEANLKKLLEEAPHLGWAAGYDKSVEWVDSTLFDIFFWGRIESRDDATKGRRTHTLVAELVDQVRGLADELGFRLQYRYGQSINSVTSD
jgi:hypothetical protein